MERCKTCRYWATGVGTLEHACLHGKVGEDEGRQSESDDCLIGSDESVIYTGPNFGCVHHEPC